MLEAFENAVFVNQGIDGQLKQWHGIHLTRRPGQEVGDAAREERIVCIVKV